MKPRLSTETRALLAARGWHVTSLYQPPWLFEGPRKLANVAKASDPWQATVHDGPSVLESRQIGSAAAPTAEEAVLKVIRPRADLRAALGRLEDEIEQLIGAIHDR